MLRFPWWRAAVLGLAALPAGATGCGGDAAPPPGRPGVPGVVIVCVDTLRADAVGGPQAPRPHLPALEAFAREATTLRDVSANAAWTAPSVATLLTGLLPTRHGVDGDGMRSTLGPAPETLAEVLSRHGWFTSGATSSGWLTRDQGFAQGFRDFGVDFDRRGPADVVGRWAAARPADRPFFLFLHTVAPHDPYGDKTSFHRGGCPEATAQDRLAADLAAHMHSDGAVTPDLYERYMRVTLGDPCGRHALYRALGAERLEWLGERKHAWMEGGYRSASDGGRSIEADARAWYVAGLAYVDRILAETFAALEAARLPPGTVVLVTSDHGEGLGETGALVHGQRLQDAVVRVPFVIRAPGRLPAGTTVPGGAGLVDVLPTVLDLVGLPVPQGLDGRSLLPLLRGEAAGHAVVAEAERAPDPADGRVVRLLSVRRPESKWVLLYDERTGSPLEERVYDLLADPEESQSRRISSPADLPPALADDVADARARLAVRWHR